MRVTSIIAAAVVALASIVVSFMIPLKYPGSRSYDPSATWQARASLGLILLAIGLLVLGAVATVRTNSRREGEPGYSAYGALLSLVLPFLFIAGAWVARGAFVQ